MELHCLLRIFFTLNLMVMTAHGALPPELYWKMMLPSTPMPKAIIELLGGDVSIIKKSVDAYTQENGSKYEFPILKLDAEEILSQENEFFRWGLSNDANVFENLGASHHQLHMASMRLGYCKEDQLHSGHKFYMYLNKLTSPVPLLPREIAQKIPLSRDSLKEVLEILSVKPNSEDAENVEKAIAHCEAPAMEGEEKYCATSLESMMDFVTSKLGKNVRAMSTDVEKGTKPLNLVVKDGVKKLSDDRAISCHPLTYPYVLYMCHELRNTSSYFVPLGEEDDGVRVKAIAVCHKDTLKWDPNHLALKVLKLSPGTPSVCHFFPQGHLLWITK